MDHTICTIMKKLILSLLGIGSLVAVVAVIISNSKRHAALVGGVWGQVGGGYSL